MQRRIDAAKAAPDAAQKKELYAQALDAVRDEDQTNVVARELKKLGVDVDLPRHFGFLTKWHVIGPFPNPDRKGFDTVFPPEKEIRLDATYDGKAKPIQWQAFEIKDERGKLDFNKPLGMEKEATAYATTTFDSGDRARCRAAARLQKRLESVAERRAAFRPRRISPRPADGPIHA